MHSFSRMLHVMPFASNRRSFYCTSGRNLTIRVLFPLGSNVFGSRKRVLPEVLCADDSKQKTARHENSLAASLGLMCATGNVLRVPSAARDMLPSISHSAERANKANAFAQKFALGCGLENFSSPAREMCVTLGRKKRLF
jgi:hypothetical protein